MSTLEQIYAKGSMLGRDLFHYGLTAVVFSFCILTALPFMNITAAAKEKLRLGFWDGLVTGVLKGGVWEQTGILFCLILLSFAVGNLLLSIGFFYRNIWKEMFGGLKHIKGMVAAEKKLSKIVADLTPSLDQLYSKTHEFQIFGEILAYQKAPDVHAKFIERYNTLTYLRLGLASAMLTGGVTSLGLQLYLNATIANVPAVLWIVLSLIFFRQYFVTRTGFLNRVTATYVLLTRATV